MDDKEFIRRIDELFRASRKAQAKLRLKHRKELRALKKWWNSN